MRPGASLWHQLREFCDDIRVCWRYLCYHDRLQREVLAATFRGAMIRRRF